MGTNQGTCPLGTNERDRAGQVKSSLLILKATPLMNGLSAAIEKGFIDIDFHHHDEQM